MPFATSCYVDRRLMIMRAWSHITLADLRAYQQELGQRPEFDRTWAHVFDARDAVQFEISSEEIRLSPRRACLPRAHGARWSRPTVRSLASSACTPRCSNFMSTDRRSGCSQRETTPSSGSRPDISRSKVVGDPEMRGIVAGLLGGPYPTVVARTR